MCESEWLERFGPEFTSPIDEAKEDDEQWNCLRNESACSYDSDDDADTRIRSNDANAIKWRDLRFNHSTEIDENGSGKMAPDSGGHTKCAF